MSRITKKVSGFDEHIIDRTDGYFETVCSLVGNVFDPLLDARQEDHKTLAGRLALLVQIAKQKGSPVVLCQETWSDAIGFVWYLEDGNYSGCLRFDRPYMSTNKFTDCGVVGFGWSVHT